MARLVNAVMVLEYDNGSKGALICGGENERSSIDEIVQALKDPAIGWAYQSADEFIMAMGELIERRRAAVSAERE